MQCGAEIPDSLVAIEENGSSYIQINQDLASFSFHSDFKSIGNSGKVGYVVYSQDLAELGRSAAVLDAPFCCFCKK